MANDLGVKNALNFEETSVGTEEMWENYRVSTVAYYEKARRSELRGEYFDEDQDFFNEKAKSRRITPGYIHRLLPNEIVVFGSNILATITVAWRKRRSMNGVRSMADQTVGKVNVMRSRQMEPHWTQSVFRSKASLNMPVATLICCSWSHA